VENAAILCTKTYINLWKFDEVLTETKMNSFFETPCSALNMYILCSLRELHYTFEDDVTVTDVTKLIRSE